LEAVSKLQEPRNAEACDLAAKEQTGVWLVNLQQLGKLDLRQLPRLDFSPDRNPEIVFDLYFPNFLRGKSQVFEHIAGCDVAGLICNFCAWHLSSPSGGAA
jgi:hypothetical protein